jgi:hypothetical protein
MSAERILNLKLHLRFLCWYQKRQSFFFLQKSKLTALLRSGEALTRWLTGLPEFARSEVRHDSMFQNKNLVGIMIISALVSERMARKHISSSLVPHAKEIIL